jgi:RHS repeat-associated protein
VTNTTPNPGGGSPEVAITTFNNMMQPTSVLQPDATTIYSVWLLTGELGLQYGSRTYPVGYSYDYAGRMQTMTNWSNYSGGAGARVTTWNYSSQRGFLTGKTYADGNGPSYSYTGAGRLASRTWVRGITTSYAYDTTGSLTNIAYNDGVTPGVTNSYNRLGRLNSVFDNGMTDALTYNLANELLSESFSGGVLNGLSVTNVYDQYLRRTNLTAWASGVLTRAIYGYDTASRLASVSDGTNNAAYTYLANSPLVSQIVLKQNSTTRMTTTKSYDFLNRLTQISSAPSASYTSPLTFNYNYNPANQRTKDTLADGSYWVYGYDSLGQVTNACKYFSDGTPVAGQQFDYTFDTIGNRTQTLAGGDQTGSNLRTANYTNNVLNQIASRDVAPYVDVMGASILTNAVMVNGTNAYRKEEYFRAQLPANNTNSALWTNIGVSGGQSVTGNVYVAQEPEQFSYDADGNLTNDGRWAYTWDGENRLVGMTVNTNVGPPYQLTFAYDAKGRRIQKLVATNGVALSTNKFLYDGWNLVAETRPDNSLIRSYMWGGDLSGTMQGAGGVGGLLEVSYYGSSTTNCFPAFDGNGNVAALINAADGTTLANYDYGPFGEVIRSTGPMAKVNPFRFSTIYQDDESDLLMYVHRPYKASTGTWLCKDPISELGFILLKDGWIKRNSSNSGYCPSCAKHASIVDMPIGDLNAYLFAGNDSVNRLDYLGLDIGTTAEAAWEAAQKALPGEEFDAAFKVFGACNSVGLGLAWARTQYQDCLGDALNGPPSQDAAAEKACEKKWQPIITLFLGTYDKECKCTVPPKHWWWPF